MIKAKIAIKSGRNFFIKLTIDNLQLTIEGQQ